MLTPGRFPGAARSGRGDRIAHIGERPKDFDVAALK
jgi:hypothetical protein